MTLQAFLFFSSTV